MHHIPRVMNKQPYNPWSFMLHTEVLSISQTFKISMDYNYTELLGIKIPFTNYSNEYLHECFLLGTFGKLNSF